MGASSQTGLAATARFPGLKLDGGTQKFLEIYKILLEDKILAILPVWNSHLGEIPKTEILNSIFEKKLKVQELWPKRITFECNARSHVELGKIKKVISVNVVGSQCSYFIERLRQQGGTFIGRDGTTLALTEFRSDTSFDAILNAPHQCDNRGFVKLQEDVSNPINFTTFVLLGNVDSKLWKGRKWRPLRDYGLPKMNIVFGVEMDTPKIGFSEAQHSLFEQLTQNLKELNQIAKVIFVVKREGGRCGLLIESSIKYRIQEGISLEPDDEGIIPNIEIKRNLGETHKEYVQDCFDLFRVEFPGVLRYDFVKHKGTKACFYACPPLNIFTHGFEEEVVEQVVRKIIDLNFKLIDNGIACTRIQRRFFEKYKKNYYKQGAGFIKFNKL